MPTAIRTAVFLGLCLFGATASAEDTCKNHDTSKCRDSGNDCCVTRTLPEAHSCADGYTLVETSENCRVWSHDDRFRDYSCIPAGSSCEHDVCNVVCVLIIIIIISVAGCVACGVCCCCCRRKNEDAVIVQPGVIVQQQPGVIVQEQPGMIVQQQQPGMMVQQQQPGMMVQQQQPGAMVQQQPTAVGYVQQQATAGLATGAAVVQGAQPLYGGAEVQSYPMVPGGVSPQDCPPEGKQIEA